MKVPLEGEREGEREQEEKKVVKERKVEVRCLSTLPAEQNR